MKIFLLGFCILALHGITATPNNFVEEVFNWKKVEYESFPPTESSFVGPYKYYIPENENIISMGFHPASGLMIVALLRTRPGVSTTLGAFCAGEYSLGASPRIWKFPNSYVNDLKAADFAYYINNEGQTVPNPVSANPYNQWENSFHNRFHKNQFYPYQQFPFQWDTSISGSERPINIQRIVAVSHITIDERCNRVFFVDNGQLNYNKNATYVIQKPALVVVGLPANGCHIRNFPVLRRAEFPDHVIAKGSTGFTHVTLDYQPGDTCHDLYVYFVNIIYSFLTVYDYKLNDFWTFEHETFQPVAAESFFVFDKTFNYQLKMGIGAVSLGYPDEKGDRLAYYTNIAGTGVYSVSTKVLKDKSKSGIYFDTNDFEIMGYLGCKNQPIKTVVDYTTGVMFYSQVQSNQVLCWNMSKPLNLDNIGVVYDSEDYKFGSQIFVDSLGFLWFQTSYLPFIYHSDLPLDLNEVNSKIFRVKIHDAIRGTVCGEGITYQ